DRAIVRHEADEERSLFPRLARVVEARSIQAKLVEEHRAQEELWTRLRNVSPEAKSDLESLARELRASYTRHVAVEEEQLFPLAEAQLSGEEWDAIAQ